MAKPGGKSKAKAKPKTPAAAPKTPAKRTSSKKPGNRDISLRPGMSTRLSFDLEKVQGLASVYMTDEEIARLFKCSVSAIEREKRRNRAFREAIETGQAEGKFSLRRAQMKLALEGNATMQIWLGKQILGQKDKVSNELSGPNGSAIAINAIQPPDDGRLERIAALLSEARRSISPEAGQLIDGNARTITDVEDAGRPADDGAGEPG